MFSLPQSVSIGGFGISLDRNETTPVIIGNSPNEPKRTYG